MPTSRTKPKRPPSIRPGSKHSSFKERRKTAQPTSDAEPSHTATPTAGVREKKRIKTDSLAWKPVNTSNIVGIDEGGGMMMLEELEDVGVEWEEGETGTKVARFVVCPCRSLHWANCKISAGRVMMAIVEQAWGHGD